VERAAVLKKKEKKRKKKLGPSSDRSQKKGKASWAFIPDCDGGGGVDWELEPQEGGVGRRFANCRYLQ